MQDLSAAFPDCANLAMKAKRLEQSGEIVRLKKGLYMVSPAVSRREVSPFLLANHIYGPSYVSMQTALRYYGLIPEAVYAVQSMTLGTAKTTPTVRGRLATRTSPRPTTPSA
jgi:predicted transcriptional regulator of viral defense system